MVIIGHNNRFNFFSTISDAPIYESFLTEQQVKELIKNEFGYRGLDELDSRLRRVYEKGTSSLIDNSLESTVFVFLDENNLSIQEFIKKYL